MRKELMTNNVNPKTEINDEKTPAGKCNIAKRVCLYSPTEKTGRNNFDNDVEKQRCFI
jgi:hypothetical protein